MKMATSIVSLCPLLNCLSKCNSRMVHYLSLVLYTNCRSYPYIPVPTDTSASLLSNRCCADNNATTTTHASLCHPPTPYCSEPPPYQTLKSESTSLPVSPVKELCRNAATTPRKHSPTCSKLS